RSLAYELAERAEVESGKTLDGVQVKDTSKSPTGVGFELGGILRFTKFLISAGYHTVNAK
ncbi:PEGA domain-containing protein, partial [Bacteroides nordii]|nr:PEGA domain-containing protein [Bacteroides nordii]